MPNVPNIAAVYLAGTSQYSMVWHTHQFFSIFWIVINDRLSIEKEEDAVSRDLGPGVVRSKGRRLSDGDSSKDDHNGDGEDVHEWLLKDVAIWQRDKEGTEPVDQSKHEEDESRTETIRQGVELGVHRHCMPKGKR